jgi:hypothetical protein
MCTDDAKWLDPVKSCNSAICDLFKTYRIYFLKVTFDQQTFYFIQNSSQSIKRFVVNTSMAAQAAAKSPSRFSMALRLVYALLARTYMETYRLLASTRVLRRKTRLFGSSSTSTLPTALGTPLKSSSTSTLVDAA